MNDFQMQRSIEARDDATLAAIEDAAQAAEDRAGEISYAVMSELDGLPDANALMDLVVEFDGPKSPMLDLANEVVYRLFSAVNTRSGEISEATGAALKLYAALEEAMVAQRERDARRGWLS